MKDEQRRMKLRQTLLCFSAAIFFLTFACGQGARRSTIPVGARSALDTAIEDIDAGRYEKLYREAADEWRTESTLDESKATFQRSRDKLGSVRTRSLATASEQESGVGSNKVHTVLAAYQTSFERGDGMETFSLVERNGTWYLARYFVSSTALR